MKKTQDSDDHLNEMRAEYHFDYSKAKPNRFAREFPDGRLMIMLDPDIAKVFHSSDDVNRVLRALVTTMPKVTV